MENLEDGIVNLKDKISNLGGLPCFCMREAENGVPRDKVYTFSVLDIKASFPICEKQMEFMSLFGWPSLLNIGLSALIVI